MFPVSAFLFALAFTSGAPQIPGDQPSQPIVVRLHECVDLPPGLYLRARDELHKIFAGAGLDVELQIVRPEHSWLRRAKPKKLKSLNGARVIEAEVINVPDVYLKDALGLARPFATGGTQVEIFYSRVKRITDRRPAYAGRIFAHVLAHEVTHVIMRLPEHSAEGLMKARWNEDDFWRMGAEDLPFDERDIVLMHLSIGEPVQTGGF